MNQHRALQILSVPAWLVLFTLCGAFLGLVAWGLSWILAVVKAL